MNRSVLCLYEINKKFTLGPQKFLLFKGGGSEGGVNISRFSTAFKGRFCRLGFELGRWIRVLYSMWRSCS